MTTKSLLGPSCRLVLVSPMYAGNVGAVARVAANFELSDVRIVNPLCRWNEGEAKLYAKGQALAVLDGMQECQSLEVALKGCGHTVGFTRRSGELRRPSIEVRELSSRVSTERPLALVFGRENGGLTHDELLACSEVCSFAVGELMPSLNLSHAVAIAVARIYEDLATAHPSSQSSNTESESPAAHESLAALFSHWQDLISDLGMTTAGNRERMHAHIVRLLQRGRPTERDVGFLRAFLSKAQVALGTRRRGKPVESAQKNE